MDYKNRIVKTKEWIPVPNEGWEIAAASPANPNVSFLNGYWQFIIEDRKQRHWYSIDEDCYYAWDTEEDQLDYCQKPVFSELEQGFYKADYPLDDWTLINVPCNWEIEGHSKPVFAHQSLHLDEKVGFYRRHFTCPAHWQDGRIILQGEGIAASAEVYVNEQKVGYHDGGFVPFQIDITDTVKEGEENLIAIKVIKGDVSTVHDNSGQWMLSGIYRDIFLFNVPTCHVTDFSVKPDFEPEAGTGILNLDLLFSEDLSCHDVEVTLFDLQGNSIDRQTIKATPGSNEIHGSLVYNRVKAWHPEEPVLYHLECSLVNNGEIIETVREEIGFRRFASEGSQFMLNGKPFLVRGVTRHSIYLTRGRSLTVGDMMNEIKLMREANMTGVRSHPYPFDPRFIKICARYGIIVCSGYCLCGYGTWGNPWSLSEKKTYPLPEEDFDQNYRRLFNERYHYFAPLIYGRYKNLTAIGIWSLANESASCDIMLPVARFLKEVDQTRFIVSSGEICVQGYSKLQVADEIRKDYLTADTLHYPERANRDQFDKLPFYGIPRPIFYTEAAHSFCNRDNFLLEPNLLGDTYGYGLKQFFDIAVNCPEVGGYFIFEWSDQSVMQKGDPATSDSFIRPWHGYKTYCQNLKGIIGPNKEPKPNYYHVKQVYAQVGVDAVTVSETGIQLKITNNYYHRNLKDLEFRLFVSDGAHQLTEARQLDIDLSPGEQIEITEEFGISASGRCFQLEVIDRQWENPLLTRQFYFKQQNWTGENAVTMSCHPGFENRNLRSISSPNLTIQLLSNPELTLGKRPESLEIKYIGMGHIADHGTIDGVTYDEEIESIEIVSQTETQNGLELTRNYRLKCGQISETLSITNQLEQQINVSQRIHYQGETIAVLDLGLALDLPASLEQVCWIRNGLWDYYPNGHSDRLTGSLFLEQDDPQIVNPYRYPTTGENCRISNVKEAMLLDYSKRGLRFKATGKEEQMVRVKTGSDGQRHLVLGLNNYSTKPFNEFSFNQPGSRAFYQNLKSLTDNDTIENNWIIEVVAVE